jgi:hypothetical protein
MSVSPLAVFSASMLLGTARGEIQLLTARCIAGSLIQKSGRRPRLEGWGQDHIRWFETREDALLAMKKCMFGSMF